MTDAELNLTPHTEDPDRFYARLIALHKDLDDAESHKLNGKIILLLANHIGDARILSQALEIAGGASNEPG